MVTVTITGTNDAPVLDTTKTPVFSDESATLAGTPSGAVGTLVSSLVSISGGINNVSDADQGALTGIAVVGANANDGTWWYSTNAGSSWALVGTVTATSALLLAADSNTRIYLQANSGFSGSDLNAITFRAWDQTTGVLGTKVYTTVNGGSTAFSTDTDTAKITVGTLKLDLNGSGPGNDNTVSDGSSTSPIVLAPSGTIVDTASPTILSMIFTLTNPQDNSSGTGGINIKEALTLNSGASSVANSDHLSVTFTANANQPETLVIVGPASAADYQTILNGLQYADAKVGGRGTIPRTITVTVKTRPLPHRLFSRQLL